MSQTNKPANAPPEIDDWNWGAFWLGPIWAFGNRVRGPFFWYMVLTVGSIPFWVVLIFLHEITPYPTTVYETTLCATILSWVWFIFFCLSTLLSIAHLFVYPIGILCLGAKGSQRAWESRHWRSLGEFKRTQRRWATAGWLLGIPVMLFNYFGVCLLVLMFAVVCIAPYSR